jgi:ABC-type lipoprotein export system ATPase subunit
VQDGWPFRESSVQACANNQAKAMNLLPRNGRPVVVAIAGPNGAGKTTFYFSHLQAAGLRFINADLLARELNLDAYAAADLVDALRKELIAQRESFVPVWYRLLPTTPYLANVTIADVPSTVSVDSMYRTFVVFENSHCDRDVFA